MYKPIKLKFNFFSWLFFAFILPLNFSFANNGIEKNFFKKGVYFVHVPKTAGEKLIEMLEKYFREDGYLNSQHLAISSTIISFNSDIPMITTIRNPLRRAISKLRYTKMHAQLLKDEALIGKKLGLCELTSDAVLFFKKSARQT